jgi:hypothetical protein
MEPADFHAIGGMSFSALRRELGWLPDPAHPVAAGFCEAVEERLTRAIANQWPAPPGRPRSPALARGPAGGRRPTGSRRHGRARTAPVADARRAAVLLRRSLAATAPAAASAPCPMPCRYPCACTAATSAPGSKPPTASLREGRAYLALGPSLPTGQRLAREHRRQDGRPVK